ncbi:hypothetical protein ACFL3D_01945 [Candidatus Omnitrophota bacterium]
MESNILKIGDKVYGLTEINCNDFDFEHELIQFHEQSVQTETQASRDALVEQSIEDFNRQIEHVNAKRETTQVTIPEDMHYKSVGVYNNELMKLRPVIYAPKVFKTHKANFRHMGIENIPMVANYIASDRPAAQKVRIIINPPLQVPINIGYCESSNQLITMDEVITFHTFSGGTMCTGRTSAREYWNLPDQDFEDVINTVNMFSLASQYFVYNGNAYSFNQLITQQSIVRIEEEGRNTWQPRG